MERSRHILWGSFCTAPKFLLVCVCVCVCVCVRVLFSSHPYPDHCDYIMLHHVVTSLDSLHMSTVHIL